MPPSLYDVQIARQTHDTLVVLWRYVVAIGDSAARVRILRSYAAHEAFTEIADVPLSDGLYEDSDHPPLDVHRTVYYRLRLEAPSGTAETGPYFLHDRLDAFQRAVRRRMEMYLRNGGARPMLIYQPAFGPETSRCPKCWDAESQQAVVSNCQTCLGTTYVGTVAGYYNPVLTLVDLLPPPKRQTVDDVPQQTSTTAARMAWYPLLKPNDVFREIGSGRMWLVTDVVANAKDGAVLTQDPVQLREIRPRDAEYALPVPLSVRPVLRRRRPRLERLVADDGSGATALEVYV